MNCTHGMGVPGQPCPWACGTIVPEIVEAAPHGATRVAQVADGGVSLAPVVSSGHGIARPDGCPPPPHPVGSTSAPEVAAGRKYAAGSSFPGFTASGAMSLFDQPEETNAHPAETGRGGGCVSRIVQLNADELAAVSAAVASGDPVALARDGVVYRRYADDYDGVAELTTYGPPSWFVDEGRVPCKTCGGAQFMLGSPCPDGSDNGLPCPDCRFEFVWRCPDLIHLDDSGCIGLVTFGFGFPIGEPELTSDGRWVQRFEVVRP